MESESIGRDDDDERNNCFSKIQLVGEKNRDETTLASENAIHPPLFWFSKPALFATSGI